MFQIIFPISSFRKVKSLCSSGVIYLQFFEKSSHTCSAFFVSASVSFEIKCALYLLLRYDSTKLTQTERLDLRIWSVRLNFSSGRNLLVSSQISIANLYAF